jgi:hypothetical protein
MQILENCKKNILFYFNLENLLDYSKKQTNET